MTVRRPPGGHERLTHGPLLGPVLPREAPLRRATPFLAAMLAGFAAAYLQAEGSRPASYLIALGLGALLVGSIPLVPWDRLPSLATTLPPLLLLGIIGFLRDTTDNAEALTSLILLPVLWLALYNSRVGVALGIAAVALALFLPLLAAGDAVTAGARQSAFVWLLVAAFTGTAVNGLVRDLRNRALAFEQTSRLDPLTGLENRRALKAQLPLELKRARTLGYPICVAMLDLDHFKLFNDQFGHPAGDRLLQEVAEGWRTCLRGHDTLARYGGEEFCAILPNVDIEGATRVAERLRMTMPQGQTVSIGLAQVRDGDSGDSTLAHADQALYKAKCQGRNRIAAVSEQPLPAPTWPHKLRVAGRTPDTAT